VSAASFRALAREAAALYPPKDRYARHFAFGKLTRDPVFRHIWDNQLIASGGATRVLDLGCGQALIGALLSAGRHPGDWRYHGIDSSRRDIERARAALPARCEVVDGDVRTASLPASDAVFVVDVLHYIEPDAQADLLRRVREALAPGGVLVMRVADASPSLRFRYTEAVDRVVTRLRGQAVKRLYSVPLAQRRRQLEGHGFRVEERPMSEGTPFANVLLVAR
jgi:trans-aconitate methyltransferase